MCPRLDKVASSQRARDRAYAIQHEIQALQHELEAPEIHSDLRETLESELAGLSRNVSVSIKEVDDTADFIQGYKQHKAQVGGLPRHFKVASECAVDKGFSPSDKFNERRRKTTNDFGKALREFEQMAGDVEAQLATIRGQIGLEPPQIELAP